MGPGAWRFVMAASHARIGASGGRGACVATGLYLAWDLLRAHLPAPVLAGVRERRVRLSSPSRLVLGSPEAGMHHPLSSSVPPSICGCGATGSTPRPTCSDFLSPPRRRIGNPALREQARLSRGIAAPFARPMTAKKLAKKCLQSGPQSGRFAN